MIKRILGIWLCLLAAYNFSEASIVKFGPKLAITSSTLKLSTQAYTHRQLKLDPALGWQAGIFARLSLPIISIQPELVLSQSGTIYDFYNKQYKLQYTQLELPVMVGISILGLVRIQVGPSFTYLLLAQEGDKQAANTKNVKIDYELLHIGYQVGLATDIWRFTVELKYAGGLSQFAHRVFNMPTSAKQNLALLSLGFNLL